MGIIPPDILSEALASKARVRARIEQIAARIAAQESRPINEESDSNEDTQIIATLD
ncbi:MAG: hypothetical protein GY895_16225 [Phycisphaera sp.]|nr:hypothetical protein [Phycisphaera sp.]